MKKASFSSFSPTAARRTSRQILINAVCKREIGRVR